MQHTNAVPPRLDAWFESYVSGYCNGSDDENIILKRDHSRRVCSDIQLIATSLKCSAQQQRLAAVVGLLHDIGRFEQYRHWGTFADARSTSHAALGVEVLQQEPILQSFSPEEQHLVITAVRHHSALHLPAELDAEERFYCQLIRDADKLDIFKVVTDYYADEESVNTTIELDLPKTDGYTPAVYQQVLQGDNVDYREIRNLNDFKLMQAGWVYALNFAPTLQLVKQRGYIDKLRAALPPDAALDELFARIAAHEL